MPRTIYLLRKRALGDVLWIEPVIRQLSNKYEKVIVFTKHNELFDNYPCKNVFFINELSLYHKINLRIHAFLKRKDKYINLDDAYEIHPKMHVLHAYQKRAQLQITEEYPRINLPETSSDFNLPKNKYAIIHLETLSTRNYREVYGIDWEKIVSYLKERNYTVLEIGKNPQKIIGCDFIKTTIPQLITLLKGAELFIGIDSGPSHLAATLNVKCLLFFGAVNPKYRHFFNLLNGIIMQNACIYQHCYHEVISRDGPICKLVGNDSIPPCSIHDTKTVISNIQKLIEC